MNIGRTTTLGTSLSLLNYMKSSNLRYTELSEQASSGYKVTTLSDDPSATKSLLNIKAQLSQLNGYLDNMNIAQNELDTMDSSLSSLTDLVQKATDLATEGANGTYSADDLNNIKTQITQIIESVVDLANAKYDGKYIFSGTATSIQPYEISYDTSGNITDITYKGTASDSAYERYVTISDGVSVAINTTGDQIFGSYSGAHPTESSGILSTLMDLSKALGNNDKTAVSSYIDDLNDSLDSVSATRTKFASIGNRFDLTKASINTTITTLKTSQSDLKDTDLAEVMSDLAIQQTALEATYQVFSQVSGMSLLDYL